MEVQLAATKLNKSASAKHGATNKIDIRLTKIFEEITYYKRGAKFNAYR